jgi:hypothetical protein
MPHLNNKHLIASIQNGEEDVLFYLSDKYFQSARRWLRRNGCRDSDTPSLFSNILVKIYREIQENKISPHVDFESFFFNSLQGYALELKPKSENNFGISQDNNKDIIESCYSILDETSRKILSERFVEKLSFEQIAARHNFSNPVIAQFEFDKAFFQFERITRARLNIIHE